mmetsp:Transcript_15968/g.18046  ORF Transcript_15968/g.18046 Transcript_15968/m.18046 type:complete len:320 (+) Transcript_15968:21-980(+)
MTYKTIKKKNSAVLERTNRMRKWIRLLQKEGRVISPFEIGWKDLEDAETKGRWWIVGGVWTGQQEKLVTSRKEFLNTKDKATKIRGSVGDVISSATPKLLNLAQKQRMNTDVRRAIFCILLDSNDYIDAFEKLVSLNLNDRQERDIVHVIIRCCGSSRKYNPYFAHLSQRVCEYHHRFKFTYQLAYWDVFKQFDEMKESKIINLASLLAHLIANFSLSLSILKVVDFSFRDSKNGIRFFNAFFYNLLHYDEDDTKTVMKIFSRLANSKDFHSISDGILLFFHHHLSLEHEDEERTLKLRKRANKVKRMLQLLASKVEKK